jgi:hypothetical protein
MPDNFFTYIYNALLVLFNQDGPVLLNMGTSWLPIASAITILVASTQVVLGMEGLGIYKRVLLRIGVGYLMMQGYSRPVINGHSLVGTITVGARDISNTIEAGSNQKLQDKLNTAYVRLERPSLMNWVGFTYYFGVVLGIAFVQLILLYVVGFGILAMGVCTVLGPLAIDCFVLVGAEWLWTGWLRSFIQYSLYQVVASSVVLCVTLVLTGFFDANPGPYTLADIERMFILFGEALGFASFSLLRVPSLTNSITSGRSGEGWFRG